MLQWDLNGMCGGDRDKWFPIVYTPSLLKDGTHEVFPESHDSAGALMYNHTPIMETMLWAVFNYSVWEITEDNWEEVWMRIRMMEVASGGTWLRTDTTPIDTRGVRKTYEDRPIKPEEVHQFVGFKINGGSETKRKFHGRVVKTIRERIMKEMTVYKDGLTKKEKKISLENADSGNGEFTVVDQKETT